MVGGRAYANFHKMYQRAMKIARLIDEVGVESRAVSGGKRKFGPNESSQGNRNFIRFNHGRAQDKGKCPMQQQKIRPWDKCGHRLRFKKLKAHKSIKCSGA